MSALSIQPTYPIFTETNGLPLENGYIWIGAANLDPQGNPINVYWDAALTIPAGQPIRTLAGYPTFNGTPARLYVNSDYSIRVMNKNGNTVYSAPAATERYSGVVLTGLNAADVQYDPAGTRAVATTVQAKLRETVSVKDFGAVGDGATDDTAAIQAAINYASNNGLPIVYLPSGKYIVSTLYLTYDAALNPGFVATRPGRIILKGDGQMPGAEAGLWNSSARVVGTVISSTATTLSAIVMSTAAQGTSGSGFPNRKQILRDITVVAETTAYVIENNGAPDESGLEDVTVIQTNAAGNGVLWLSSWYTYWKKVVITNTVTSTGVGARFGSSIFAGLYSFETCSFAGSFANSVLMSGMAGSSNFNFKGCSFEGATSAGALINSQCRNINFDGCYFEGNGVNHLRVDLSSAVETLTLNNCMIFGGTTAASAPTGPLIYLSYASSADISNCTFFRPHTTCVYNAYNAGGLTGQRTTLRNCNVDVSGATYSGGAFFYVVDSNSQVGVPLLINNQIIESAVVVLVNPSYLRGSDVSPNTMRSLSYGFTSVFERAMDVIGETDGAQITQASARIYTTTATGCVVQLPSGSATSTARMFYLGNKASSTQPLAVLQPGGATLATLAAGEGIVCVGNPNTSLYVGFKTTFVG